MLIEIPDINVILSVILAFVAGLVGIYGFYKFRRVIMTNHIKDSSQLERLQYYEKQFIDMKIRLDALELDSVGSKTKEDSVDLKQFLENLVKKQEGLSQSMVKNKPKEVMEQKTAANTNNIDPNDITEYVLHLITDKDMTSRDIQKTLKRSREHTSRFMKKLFEDGLVKRNTKTKPYTYSITEKGLERIGLLQNSTIA